MQAPTRANSTNPRPGQSAFPDRSSQRKSRGTRGAKRSKSSSSRSSTQSPTSQDRSQIVNDPAARQQMKQTMAIALMTNPAIPLPFPLSTILGVALLTYPSGQQNRSETETEAST